jgi:hypothetical protein
VRWLAGLNHTNGLHYAPYTLPFSFPKPQSHNLTRPAILIRRLKHLLPMTFLTRPLGHKEVQLQHSARSDVRVATAPTVTGHRRRLGGTRWAPSGGDGLARPRSGHLRLKKAAGASMQ